MNTILHAEELPVLELSPERDVPRSPWVRATLERELTVCVEETFVAGVLADRLPPDPSALDVSFELTFGQRPSIVSFDVRLASGAARFQRSFPASAFARRATDLVLDLKETGRIPRNETAYAHLVAAVPRRSLAFEALAAPPIRAGRLAELGLGRLGTGRLDPERPVLIRTRVERDILDATVRAGFTETGGAMLGTLLALDEPLPGTRTRIVTVLTEVFCDARHEGHFNSFTFDHAALLEASRRATLRGRGESVLTAFHSHGWGCGACNRSADCSLAACTDVSLDDYRVFETLFPGKAAVMPIAGRLPADDDDRPHLRLHAWNGGRLLPLPWRRVHDLDSCNEDSPPDA